MAATDSVSMEAFRANVRLLLDSQPERNVTWLEATINERRKGDETKVSRPFLYNMLNGKFDCSIPFAEEIANALQVPLATLFTAPPKKSR